MLLWAVLLICLVASLVAARAKTLAITTRDRSNSSRVVVVVAVPLTQARLPLISPRVQQDLPPQGLLRDRSPTERPHLASSSITSNTVLISNNQVKALRTVLTNSSPARTPLTVRISSNPALTHSSLVPTHLMAHTSNSLELTRNMELVNNTQDRANRTAPTRNSQARTLHMDLTSSLARINNSQVLTRHMVHRLARTSNTAHTSSSTVPTLSMVEVRMDPRTTRSLLHPQEVRLNSMDSMGNKDSRVSRRNTSLLLLLDNRRTSSNMDKAIPITPRPLVVNTEALLINMDKINRPTVHLQFPATSSIPLPLLEALPEDTIPHTTEAKEVSLLMAVVPPLFHTEHTRVNMEEPTERPFEEIWKSTTSTAYHAVVP